MKERIVKFRTSVVGGFDRHDVMSYIKLLSDERNALRLQLAGRRVDEEDASLQTWRDAFEHHTGEFESAEQVLHALEAKHNEIGKQIRGLREHLELTRGQKNNNDN